MRHDYPTIAEIVEIHRCLIERFGGAQGLRDAGALEAAIMRPQSGYYQTLTEEAAALMESLAMNHPFIDGNKRIAFAATDTFLRMNGWQIDCEENAAWQDWMRLFESGQFRFEALCHWIQDHVSIINTYQ